MSKDRSRHHSLFCHLRSRTVVIALVLLPALMMAAWPARTAKADDAERVEATLQQNLFLPSLSLQPTPCFDLQPASIFGVQMFGNTGENGEFHDPLLATGADWVRVPIYWSAIEPQNTDPAQFRWSGADAAVGAARDACKRVIITHESAPDWAAEHSNSVLNPENEGDFVQYIGALAERYDGDGRNDAPGSPVVDYWEIYNEPDGSANVKGVYRWGEYPADYARILAKAHDAIKAANPDAKILFGGVAFDWFESDGGPFVRSFVEEVLAIDKGQHFDYFNYHAYPAYSASWIQKMNPDCVETDSCEGPGLLEKHQYLMQILKDKGVGDKPLIVTESGWWSNYSDIPGTEETQARYLVELFTQSKAAGLTAMVYFSLVDSDILALDYGLFSNPPVVGQTPRAKKAFSAYTTAKKWLANATFVRRLPQAELRAHSLDAYQFRNASGDIFYVAWLNPVELGVDLDGNGLPDVPAEFESLRLPHNHVEVYDIYDQRTEVVQDSDGDIRVKVGAQPVYIKVIN